MASLEKKLAFAKRHISTPDGQPFCLDGREWVLRELWNPLDGWKLWPEDPTKLCESCTERVNTIVENYNAADHTRTTGHAALGCAGLRCEPILIVAANVKRQSGKTFNIAAWILAHACLSENESIALLAGSEDQVSRLFVKNYQTPIKADEKLSRLCTVRGTKILVEKRKSDIEILPTALTSVGDTRTVVVIDECREVPPEIGTALIPTLFARGGWECPTKLRNHTRTFRGVDDSSAPEFCGVCEAVLGKPGVKLQPWFGRALLMSSAGELKDNDSDWFYEFISTYSEKPHPNVHVFRSSENLNPKSSKKLMGAFGEIFGGLESTRTSAGIEGGNEFLRKGQEFMSQSDIKRCVDPTLANLERCALPCVGFLDTSDTIEKTSLVIMAADGDEKAPWSRLAQVRLDFWVPSEQPGRVLNLEAIEQHTRSILTTFSGIKQFFVDTRGTGRWNEFVKNIARTNSVCKRWISNKGEGQEGWEFLFQRMVARPVPGIRLQPCKDQMREFAGLRWKTHTKDLRPQVVDRDRTKSHKDITEALAMCCWLADLEMRRATRSGFANRLAKQKSAIERARSNDVRGRSRFFSPDRL